LFSPDVEHRPIHLVCKKQLLVYTKPALVHFTGNAFAKQVTLNPSIQTSEEKQPFSFEVDDRADARCCLAPVFCPALPPEHSGNALSCGIS
jgi:hypothetical protein